MVLKWLLAGKQHKDYKSLVYCMQIEVNGTRSGCATAWVDASHKTDAPHLIPGEHELSSSPWGYGLQWWVPGFPDTDYTASGVYNQYIYIDPLENIVIAKTCPII